MAVNLVIRDTNGRWEFEIQDVKPAVLGAGENADLRISDRSVARLHARIYRSQEDGLWYIEDLGARNGVLVNNRQVGYLGKLPFHVGDLLQIGAVELTVALPTETER